MPFAATGPGGWASVGRSGAPDGTEKRHVGKGTVTGASPRRVGDDLVSPFDLARTLARYAGWILLATIIVTVLAAYADRKLAAQATTVHTARTRVGLTQEIEWPFYDAARDRQVTVLARPEAHLAVAEKASVPPEALELQVEIPVNQAFVEIIATAPTADMATAGANAAAGHLVETDNARVRGARQADLETARAQLKGFDDAIVGYEAQLAAVIAEEARLTAALRPATDAQVEAIELARLQTGLQRSAVETYRDEAIRARTPIVTRIAELEQDLASVTPEVEVLRYAAPAEPAPTSGGIPRWALAAAAALVVASVGALVWDREYGRLRSVAQLRGATAVPGLGELVVPRGAPGPVGRSAALCAINLRDRASQVGARIVGIVELGGAQTDVAVRGLSQQLVRAGYTVATIGPAGSHAPEAEVPLEDLVGSQLVRAATDRAWSEPPREELHVTWAQRGTIHDVAYAREALAALAASYDMVLVDCGQSDQRAEAWWSRVRSCDAVVTVAHVRRTRVSAIRRLERMLEEDTPHLGVILLRSGRPLAGGRSPRPEPGRAAVAVAEQSPVLG